MALIKIRFKRSPMHQAVNAGDAEVGEFLSDVFNMLGKKMANAIKINTRVHISHPERDSVVVSPKKWEKFKLRNGDMVTIVGVPGLGWLEIVIISLGVSVAVSILLRPSIPKKARDEGGTLYTLAGDNNSEVYSPIPSVYGTVRAPLKYIAYPSGRVNAGTSNIQSGGLFQDIIGEPPRIYEDDGNRTEGPDDDDKGGGEGNYKYGNGYYRSKQYTSLPGEGVTGETDILSILGTWGPGPIDIRDIRIGDVSIEDLVIEFQVYRGDQEPSDQEPFPPKMKLYSSLTKTENINRALDGTEEPEQDWIVFPTINDPTQARFDISFPSGLQQISSKSGKKYATSVIIEIQWKDVDEISWSGSYVTKRTFRKNTTKPFFSSISISFPNREPPALPHGANVRIRRLGIAGADIGRYSQRNQCNLVRFESSGLREDIHKLESNYSLFAARVKADARITGNLPIVTALVSRQVNDYSDFNADPNNFTGEELTSSSNPAWIYLDALIGVNNERPEIKQSIDWEAFKAWARFCEIELDSTAIDNGLNISNQPIGRFNRIIDGTITLERLLRDVSAAGYAAPRMRGLLHSIFWEAETRTPIGLLTPSTISKFSSERKWPDEVHGYRISYFDPDNDYNSNQVIAFDDGYSLENATIIRDLDGQTIGCTSRAAAWRFGRYKLADDQLHLESYQCEISLESLFFEVGDVLNLSHDVLLLGRKFGRVEKSIIFSVILPELPVSVGVVFLDQDISDLSNEENMEIQIEDGIGLRTGTAITYARWRDITPQTSLDLLPELTELDDANTNRQLVVYGINVPDPLEGAGKRTIARVGAEYALGAPDVTSTPVVVHSLSPQNDQSAKAILQDFRGESLIESWVGNVPDHNSVFDDAIKIASRIPPRPEISHVIPGAAKLQQTVSDIHVFFSDVSSTNNNKIVKLVLQWKLKNIDTYEEQQDISIGGDAVLHNVPLGAEYHIRAAWVNDSGYQGPYAETLLVNPSLFTDKEPTPPISGLRILGRPNETEFYGNEVVIAWDDFARLASFDELDLVKNTDIQTERPDGLTRYKILVFSTDADGNMESQISNDIEDGTSRQYKYSVNAGAHRYLKFKVARIAEGQESVFSEITVFNPRPSAPNIEVIPLPGRIEVFIPNVPDSPTNEPDYRYTIIWAVKEDDVGDPLPAHLPGAPAAGSTINNPETISFDISFTTRILVQVAVADTFGGEIDDWNRSNIVEVEITPAGLVQDSEGNLVSPTGAIPPLPSGFVVSPAVNTTTLHWNNWNAMNGNPPQRVYPGYDYHRETEIYRSVTNTVESAEILGTSKGTFFLDPNVVFGNQYYYWIRFVGTGGSKGAFNGTAGAVAFSPLIPDAAIANLNADKITTGILDADRIGAGSIFADKVAFGTGEVFDVIQSTNFTVEQEAVLGADGGWVYPLSGQVATMKQIADGSLVVAIFIGINNDFSHASLEIQKFQPSMYASRETFSLPTSMISYNTPSIEGNFGTNSGGFAICADGANADFVYFVTMRIGENTTEQHNLFRINISVGGTTFVAQLHGFEETHHAFVQIQIASDGTNYYLLYSQIDIGSFLPALLYQLDVTSGEITFLGNLPVSHYLGIDFVADRLYAIRQGESVIDSFSVIIDNDDAYIAIQNVNTVPFNDGTNTRNLTLIGDRLYYTSFDSNFPGVISLGYVNRGEIYQVAGGFRLPAQGTAQFDAVDIRGLLSSETVSAIQVAGSQIRNSAGVLKRLLDGGEKFYSSTSGSGDHCSSYGPYVLRNVIITETESTVRIVKQFVRTRTCEPGGGGN